MPYPLLSSLAVVFFLVWPNLVRGQAQVAPPEDYVGAVQVLDQFISHEVADKRLPALSIALVNDQKIVWARGYGFTDTARTKLATAETVYRVASVSKLFTDLAVMQLVEKGKLDLDAPVRKYLPDFKPINPFDQPITLRRLMSHRSGLVREPPEGNYFDPSVTALDRTVLSLNRTELVYQPGTRTKYSNAGIAVVGRVVEKTQNQPFARYLHQRVLGPLGMARSGFEPTPDLKRDLAAAVMWTYDGREFPAPTFELGMAPAANLYSTVIDLGRFLSALFAGGRGPGGQVVQAGTLQQMWTPQFVGQGEKSGFGLGFSIAEFEGRQRVGHSGALYGFATELAALPGDKLGVVVAASRDVANGVTRHLANEALRHMLAVRRKKTPSTIALTQPIGPERIRQLVGRYTGKDGRGVELSEQQGRLFLLSLDGGYLTELRTLKDRLVVDSPLAFGLQIQAQGDRLIIGKNTLEKCPPVKPKPVPARWQGLIGEYGWDHNTLYILEKDGRLWALIEWIEFAPLEEVDDNTFKFPESAGMYHGEKIVFARDSTGRATQAQAASIVFLRRRIEGEDGATFQIKPGRPLPDLQREALKARPSQEKGDFLEPDLVDVTALDATIKLDIRYATANNFLGAPVYASARAFLQRPAAEALVRAHRKLAGQGYGLLLHDAYRPWYVTKMFWEATPEKQRIFVANPARGSRHNRGCAVDLTLFDRQTGAPVSMVSGYDEMTNRAYAYYPGGTSQQRYHRDQLRRALEAEGFTVYLAEWWHFDYKDWGKYPILNLTFDKLGK
jgi:CubicO group peptidase (beta-lactamase class C family)/D-alanyl-D-alanine dipeptidase